AAPSAPRPATPARVPAAPVTPAAPAPKAALDPRATRIEARRIDGRDQVNMVAQDNVRLDRGDITLTSDKLYYDQIANEVSAEGKVRLVRGGDEIEGPRARVNLDTLYGEVASPTYVLQRERRVTPTGGAATAAAPGGKPLTRLVRGTGEADMLRLQGENQYQLSNATYTTCPAPDPSWYLRMRDLDLDFDRDKGEAQHSTLVFKNVPIAYTPWIDFPLSGGRQSGLLPPTVGSTTNTGFDATIPYYFNLAPNYDATIAPRYMSERGVQIGGEARYLGQQSSGVLRGEYMPEDTVEKKSRSVASWRHLQDFGHGLTGNVDATQVSDVNYFSDLSSKITSTSQSTLLQQANLNYNSGSWLTGGVMMQRYQVLSGDAPYSRRPQVTLTARQADFHGLSLSLPTEFTSFSSPQAVDGQRFVMYPQVAYPMQTSAFYLTPKVGVHASRYDLDEPTAKGDTALTRSVPVFSLDSGVVFERELDWRGREQIQTLEPRLYYVRSTYRDQSQFPVFDTARADFNFAQIFSENAYSGSDRIADSDQLTTGLQSRMVDAETGEEWLRLALAQRFYFADQRVKLPDETPREGRVANVLGGASGRVHRDVWAETALQYDPRVGLWQRAVAGVRYQPSYAKVASVSYRFQRDQFRSVDFSFQWPLWGRWYGVGRYDLNLRDRKPSEVVAGLEFQGDCWALRTVWQTLVTSETKRNNAFFIQLELNGLASVGSSPVNLLKRSISGYGKINDPTVGDPTFGNSSQP
ncbi:MAG: LPS-assembly protein LptD, partial [Candidatus Dactylopiibacterium sp.]|nr:LPS-assembly protein LptD [Candidatus Dactylopiibacterium sp.]